MTAERSAARGAHLRPLRVVLRDVAELVPQELLANPDSVRAWLRAPLAGSPLHRRLLEPLLGLRVTRLFVAGGDGVASQLRCLLRIEQSFGMTPDDEAFGAAACPEEPTLVVRASGLCETRFADAGLVGTLSEVALAPEAGRGGQAAAVLLPPGAHVAPLLAGPLSVERVLSLARGRARVLDAIRPAPTGSPRDLLATADRFLLRERGSLRGPLIGPRARVSADASFATRVVIGGESRIAPGAILADHTHLGQRCYVGAHSLIADSVLLDDTRIASGSYVLSSVVGPGLELRAASEGPAHRVPPTGSKAHVPRPTDEREPQTGLLRASIGG